MVQQTHASKFNHGIIVANLHKNMPYSLLPKTRLKFALMICLSGCWINPVQNDLFQSGPGQSKVYLGDEVSLVWSLTQSVDLAAEGPRMEIYHYDNIILRAMLGKCENLASNSRLSCITRDTSVGFSITGSGVQQTDAGDYTCDVKPSALEGTQSNEDALIYIYRAPSTPTIIGSTPSVVGDSPTLQSSATSQSLPLSESASAVIEYIWSTSADHTSSGNTITVGPLTRDHDGETVTCKANEQGSASTSVRTVTINVIYPPGAALLHTEKVTVVKGIDDLVMTCQLPAGEEGNPNTYTYQWRNPKQQSSGTGMSLTISKNALNADLHDGTWQCTTVNDAGPGIPGTKTIIVHIPSTIMKFESSHQGDLISSYSTTLTCEVESRPMAHIQLVHVDSGTELEKVDSGLRLQHTLINASCFDGGTYSCKTNNSVGKPDSRNITLDVKCPPSAVLSLQDLVAGRLQNSFTYQLPVVSNPMLLAIDVQWIFQPNSGQSRRELLPDNVEASVDNTHHPLVKNMTIHISIILESNFGTYTVTASNLHGSFSSQVNLVPEGPPNVPSEPLLIKSTAVSMEFSWTAGFDGGWPQTFIVLYRSLDSNEESSAIVDHQNEVSQGDVIVYKLKDQETIFPASLYIIRIQARNEYNKGSIVFGESALLETKERPELQAEPLVEFIANHIVISLTLINLESVNHLVATVFPATDDDASACASENTTIMAPELTIIMELLSKVGSYKITLQMYDGEDIVNSKEWISDIPKKLDTAAIVGGVLGALLLTSVLINIVLLWRKGILHKSGHQSDTRKNTPAVVYENVEHIGLEQYMERKGGTADTTSNAPDTPVSQDNKTKKEDSGFTADTDNAAENYEKLTEDYAPRLEPTVYEEMVL